jgi:hypothetical protein
MGSTEVNVATLSNVSFVTCIYVTVIPKYFVCCFVTTLILSQLLLYCAEIVLCCQYGMGFGTAGLGPRFIDSLCANGYESVGDEQFVGWRNDCGLLLCCVYACY